MPADELMAVAAARVAEPPDEEWPMPAGLHDRDHWTVYVLAEEYGVAPHPGPAHLWPAALVADLRRARYATLYARHRREQGVIARGPIERALSPTDAGLLADARRARDQLVAARERAARPGGQEGATMTDIAEQIAARLAARSAALRAGGEILERAKDAAFAAEGPGWAPLAESTVQQRGSAHPILRVTGAYRASFRAVYTDDSVALASDDWRFAVLNEGAGNAPARPVELAEADVRAACRAVAARLLRGGA